MNPMDGKKMTDQAASVDPAFIELALEMAELDGMASESEGEGPHVANSIIEEAARLHSTLLD